MAGIDICRKTVLFVQPSPLATLIYTIRLRVGNSVLMDDSLRSTTLDIRSTNQRTQNMELATGLNMFYFSLPLRLKKIQDSRKLNQILYGRNKLWRKTEWKRQGIGKKVIINKVQAPGSIIKHATTQPSQALADTHMSKCPQ